jgi:hypothetical protein
MLVTFFNARGNLPPSLCREKYAEVSSHHVDEIGAGCDLNAFARSGKLI